MGALDSGGNLTRAKFSVKRNFAISRNSLFWVVNFAASEKVSDHETPDLRLLLGLKARALREKSGRTLQAVASVAGLAVSYLSEIEKGKKYPKPDRLLALARALGVSFEELVSPRVGRDLSPLEEFARSPFLREFPFALFGLESRDLFGLVAGDPKRAGALLQTFAEIGRRYDLEVEQLLFAALRSYQQLHHNYFPELERVATEFRAASGWARRPRIAVAELAACLRDRWGYELDLETLATNKDLGELRSVYASGPPPKLYVNGHLRAEQLAFVLAREIGYRVLADGARAVTSSWLKAESFDQVLANFRASYFAGALLLPEELLVGELARWIAAKRFRPETLTGWLERFGATPEMLFYRVTELAPGRLELPRLFFLRLRRDGERKRVRPTKVLDLTGGAAPRLVGSDEHYCRRWPGVELLDDSRAFEEATPFVAERSRFVTSGSEFLVVAAARPLALRPKAAASVSLGFLVDEESRTRLRFLDDPAIRQRTVDLTCERCPLPAADCAERAAPPERLERQRQLARRSEAVARLAGRPSPP